MFMAGFSVITMKLKEMYQVRHLFVPWPNSLILACGSLFPKPSPAPTSLRPPANARLFHILRAFYA